MDKAERSLRASVHRVLFFGVCLSGGLMALGIVAGKATGLRAIQAGIVVLILTPVVRVFLLSLTFARARDWPFFLASLAVLAMLLGGAFL